MPLTRKMILVEFVGEMWSGVVQNVHHGHDGQNLRCLLGPLGHGFNSLNHFFSGSFPGCGHGSNGKNRIILLAQDPYHDHPCRPQRDPYPKSCRNLGPRELCMEPSLKAPKPSHGDPMAKRIKRKRHADCFLRIPIIQLQCLLLAKNNWGSPRLRNETIP